MFSPARKIYCEIQLLNDCVLRPEEVEPLVQDYLENCDSLLHNNKRFDQSNFGNHSLREYVKQISIYATNCSDSEAYTYEEVQTTLQHRCYRLIGDDACPAEIAEDENAVIASNCWSLPHCDFGQYWDNLIFENNLKDEVLDYSDSMLKMSRANVSSSIISSNRVILFHGPPGTGKTTLCKAVAQKIAIRNAYFDSFKLMEVNSHSLFSKWYSESGKLVMKMFDQIRTLLVDQNTLVFVLIDEIESLAKARTASLSSGEPSDSIRVVNAILTQIDSVKKFPNVLILTTSNLTDAVDDAFLDRVDLKRFVGLPSRFVTYKILLSCLQEFHDKNLVVRAFLSQDFNSSRAAFDSNSAALSEIAACCSKISGRMLRKLPVIAYALLGSPPLNTATTDDFLAALKVAALQLNESNSHSTNKNQSADSDDPIGIPEVESVDIIEDDSTEIE